MICGCRYISFFFSSRRRHTRWTGDWSSDVCSSDLDLGGGGRRKHRRTGAARAARRAGRAVRRADGGEIGRASCRGRGEDLGGGGSIKKKKDGQEPNG